MWPAFEACGRFAPRAEACPACKGRGGIGPYLIGALALAVLVGHHAGLY